jgi:hypothetical protein
MTSSQQPFIPYNEKGLAMTEEEVNAEIERVQQRITSNLQQIDDNYVKANQMLASKLLPALEKFEQASGDIWDRSKVRIDLSNIVVQLTNKLFLISLGCLSLNRWLIRKISKTTIQKQQAHIDHQQHPLLETIHFIQLVLESVGEY